MIDTTAVAEDLVGLVVFVRFALPLFALALVLALPS
jgi:hypothetical protein